VSKSLPPIPKSIYLPTGRIKVLRKKGLMENEKAFGLFHWHKREIWIDAELEPHAAWMTLEHEKVHAILMDAGLQLDDYTEERLCDTFASARVAEMLK
jgi:Zn-dependent peptidase ImmA (M78 family)